MSIVSINWGTYVISVPKSGLTLIQLYPLEIREMDINWFRLQLKDLEDSDEGMACPDTHRHNTEVTLAGLTFARVVEILDPYTITFEDGQYAVNLVGANSNIADKVNVNQVSVRSQNSAGLISTPLIEYSSFEGGIWLDQINGSEGTLFPIGTKLKPVKLLSDAKIIADYRGFNVIYIIDDAVLDTTIDFSEFIFQGQTYINNGITVNSGVNVLNAVFRNLTVTGTLDGGNELVNCRIENLEYVNGTINSSDLLGMIELKGNSDAVIINSISPDPYNPPIIDMGGSGQNLIITNFSGQLSITNLTGNSFVGIGLTAGQVMLDSTTVTAGIIRISGIGELVDEHGNFISSGLWNGGVTIQNNLMTKEIIAEAVYEEVGVEVQYGAYNHGITIDIISGTTGTTYPIGTPAHPCKTLSDALVIAQSRGFTKIYVIANLTINNIPAGIEHFDFYGNGIRGCTITIDNVRTYNCTFHTCTLTGNFSNNSTIDVYDSVMDNISNITIIANNCSMIGIIELNNTRSSNFYDCSDGIPGTVTPEIQVNDCKSLGFWGYSGGLKLTNIITSGTNISVNFNSGRLIVDSTDTQGSIVVRGVGSLVGTTNGTIIDDAGLIDNISIQDAVWEKTLP